jgi:toxin FitB
VRRWYIVDTNVLSNRNDVDGNPDVGEWLLRFASHVRISVVTIAEMHCGLLLLEAKAVATPGSRCDA